MKNTRYHYHDMALLYIMVMCHVLMPVTASGWRIQTQKKAVNRQKRETLTKQTNKQIEGEKKEK